MASIFATTVWTLTRTEYVGQCTGFGSETKCFGIFLTKPDLKTLAPFIGRHLNEDMGQAIADVITLLDTGTLKIDDYEFELDQVQVGTRLHKDD